MKHFSIYVHALLVSIFALTSISCSEMKSRPVNSDGNPIVSDQFDPNQTTFPGGVPKFLTLLKLQSPALLSTAEKQSDGSFVVDPVLQKAVLAEQHSMEQKLAQLSPDIRVVFRYRMVLNALAIEAPQSLSAQINELEDVTFVEADERFELPKTKSTPLADSASRSLADSNSMKIIGALDVHNKLTVVAGDGQVIPVRGQGLRVGIIDSGIDYTHSMFRGPGDPNVFKAIDPVQDSPLFPNTRVKGGRDFVGAKFNTSSHIYSNKLAVPDNNPLDTSGHGSHVAGTVAGEGDGTMSYDGAAPEADLYALKVFGDGGGSTSDTVVIAALEYAADPNGDLDTGDRLHVVNLSLGGGYGKPHSLYNMAVSNLTKGGTLAVVSAGNDGPVPNIVASPSTAEESLAVAASVDDMEQNWQFPAIEFKTNNHSQIVVQAIEGVGTKPIRLTGNVTGKLVYVGTAATDLTPELLAAVQGNVALIDRGDVSFDEKITRVAGAIGVVMVNNTDEEPFRMGGELKFEIPGVMVSKAIGALLKSEMLLGEAVIQFLSQEKIKKPELIDTIVGFSSQGPRAVDSLIKPEITAPGYNIISVAVGSGNRVVRMSGTSMSSPHMAGLAALLMQYHPQLTPLEIKALLMNASVEIDDAEGNVYPITRQGAGRVNVYRSATNPLLVKEGAISLGEVQVGAPLTIERRLTFKNLTSSSLTVAIAAQSQAALQLNVAESSLVLKANEEREITLNVVVSPIDQMTSELDGFLIAMVQGSVVARVPVMAVVNYLTQITASTSPAAVDGSAQVAFNNGGSTAGSAYVFQLLGQDARKPLVTDTTLASSCDLESVGYRHVERDGVTLLQFAVKIYNPITDWNICDVNIEFDVDGDGVSDREIIGTTFETMPGFGELGIAGFRSILFDSKILTSLYSDYRKQVALQLPTAPTLDYVPALLGESPMITYDHSTMAIVEVPLAKVGAGANLSVRATASYNDGDVVEGYDTLQNASGAEWIRVAVRPELKVQEDYSIPAMGNAVVTLPDASVRWVSYFPRNAFIMGLVGSDSQSQLLDATASAGSLL